MLWLTTLPFVLIGEYGWVAPIALSVISFLFLTVESMAIEIEQPVCLPFCLSHIFTFSHSHRLPSFHFHLRCVASDAVWR